MYHKSLKNREKIFAVAPMMDWSDRHCRYFHRQLSRHALLYTEMVVADAIVRGDRERLLGFDEAEHPVALQLGGSNPDTLVEATRIATQFGYDEINLNVGCPSDRVQSGTFGACLMRTPHLVADCIGAMQKATHLPVTVKCRLGVDDQDTETALDNLADAVLDQGCDALWVHARKAWLNGLSPKENRTVPPLDYDRVFRLKERLGDVFVGINGGIETLDQATELARNVDGTMLGRAAYHTPSILLDVDERIYGDPPRNIDFSTVFDAMKSHSARHLEQGRRMNHITRHMIGLFHGLPGARRYRQIMSVEAAKPDASPDLLDAALVEVDLSAAGEGRSAT
ncbi:MAG: tRNA dihydrouridine(20/20a) synthase DusA [Pseudomonadota bacterium]